jgi:hypothetical protein
LKAVVGTRAGHREGRSEISLTGAVIKRFENIGTIKTTFKGPVECPSRVIAGLYNQRLL